jgi:transcription elongation factor Elf1
MSNSEQVEIKCPKCGAEQVATVWRKLDATSDTGVREAQFGWEINIFNCNSCDLRAQMPVGLLYTDPVKQFSVQFYPMDALGKDEFYEGFRRDGEPLDDAARTDSPRPHIVFDMAEMMRYIVFREIAFEKGQ